MEEITKNILLSSLEFDINNTKKYIELLKKNKSKIYVKKIIKNVEKILEFNINLIKLEEMLLIFIKLFIDIIEIIDKKNKKKILEILDDEYFTYFEDKITINKLLKDIINEDLELLNYTIYNTEIFNNIIDYTHYELCKNKIKINKINNSYLDLLLTFNIIEDKDIIFDFLWDGIKNCINKHKYVLEIIKILNIFPFPKLFLKHLNLENIILEMNIESENDIQNFILNNIEELIKLKLIDNNIMFVICINLISKECNTIELMNTMLNYSIFENYWNKHNLTKILRENYIDKYDNLLNNQKLNNTLFDRSLNKTTKLGIYNNLPLYLKK
jgi:hypothetical protein